MIVVVVVPTQKQQTQIVLYSVSVSGTPVYIDVCTRVGVVVLRCSLFSSVFVGLVHCCCCACGENRRNVSFPVFFSVLVIFRCLSSFFLLLLLAFLDEGRSSHKIRQYIMSTTRIEF